jgi:hypothetical protein
MYTRCVITDFEESYAGHKSFSFCEQTLLAQGLDRRVLQFATIHAQK